MTRYLLTNEALAIERWLALETNPSYAQDITTKVAVAKSAAGTYFKYRPGVDTSASGDFPNIALAKSGWRIQADLLLSYTLGDSNRNLYSGGYTKVGQRFTISDTKVFMVYFKLSKIGSPTGNAIVTIRKVSDNSIIAQSLNFDVSQLTSTVTLYPFLLTTTPTINEEVRILFEYSGGGASDYVSFWYQGTNVIDGVFTHATDSIYTDNSFYDSNIIVYQIPYFNGSFVAGNWTFKVALYNNAKYGHAVKIAARLSRSANADGSNATLIGAVTESPNTITLAGAAGDIKTDSWTYDPGAVTLTNEYLFVEYRCVIVTPGSSASTKHDFMVNEDPATRDESVTPTTFTPVGGPEWKKLQYFTEPPTTGAWNKLKYASEPPVPAAWNKLLYEGE